MEESLGRFCVEDSNGAVHMDFLGFTHRINGDLMIRKPHTVR